MSPALPMTATAIATAVREGSTSATAILDGYLDRIRRWDPKLHCFLSLRDEAAHERARAIDQARHNGESLGPLAGVPVAWKDNIALTGELTTAGSRMLANYRSPFSATVLTRLEQAGAVLLGRTNMDEFGMGSSTETSAHGPTRNPFAIDCVPGGSSGGSAAAVAADLCPLALGSDTGGSIRQPAAMCGVTGLKPSHGRVSRYGLVAYASSLDCIGAIARTPEDLAIWLDAVAGFDPADATSRPDVAPTLNAVRSRADLRGLRFALPWELNGPGLDDEVAATTTRAVDQLRDLGAELVGCSLATVAHAVPTYYLIATAEAASNLARYDGVRYGLRRDAIGGRPEAMTMQTRSQGFGNEVQLRILLGTFASSFGYREDFFGRAENARRLIRNDFAQAFNRCDVIVSPTSPIPAFPLGSRSDDPLAMYLCDALTVPASLAGLPAISLPCGATADGRPIGLQLIAPNEREDLLLQIAHVFQQHTEHHLRRPSL